MIPCCKSCKKLVLIEVLEKCPNEIVLLFEQFLKIEYRHWISHLKEMSPSKKVTKKEKLLKGKLLPKLALIEVLKKCPKDARGQIISYLNSEGINVLSETIHNVLRIEAPLKDHQKRRLRKEYRKEKEVLLEIAKKRGSFKNKRKLLKQSGGFLGTLLGI
jgi:hypothetical protein